MQNEIDFELRKLEELTKVNFGELEKQIGERVGYLSELFKADSVSQGKEL
jgi:hypothetical protein